jgi:diamine N-acetyltransferase
MIQINDSRLRSVELKDLPFLKDIRTSEDVQSSVGQRIFLNDTEQENWFGGLIGNKRVLYTVFEMCHLKKWEKMGYARITEIDHINKSMMVGADLQKKYRGLGFGRCVYKLILELGFKQWGMNRLYLLVLESNSRALSLYEKLGFKVEGIQRAAVFKNGKYENYIMMSILRGEYCP